MKANALKIFRTESEAREFANNVKSSDWGWMGDRKTGNITGWYVWYVDEE